MAYVDGYFIASSAQDPDACWQWIAFLTSRIPVSTMPVRKSLARSSEYEELVGAEVAAAARNSIENAMIVPTALSELEEESRLFGVAIAVFVGVGLIYKEVDRRTVQTILSKPLTRAEFLLGKFVGLVIAIWMQMAIMLAVFGVVSLATGALLSTTHAAACLLTAIELALVVAIATFFSAFTPHCWPPSSRAGCGSSAT